MSGQGPSPMALGPHKFRGLGFGFTDLGRNLETPWGEIEVAGRMEALHWTGPKSESVTIKGVLFPEEFGGPETLEALADDAKRGRVLQLVTRAGRLHGRFVVVKIDDERSYIRADGLPRKQSYTITLKRYTSA